MACRKEWRGMSEGVAWHVGRSGVAWLNASRNVPGVVDQWWPVVVLGLTLACCGADRWCGGDRSRRKWRRGEGVGCCVSMQGPVKGKWVVVGPPGKCMTDQKVSPFAERFFPAGGSADNTLLPLGLDLPS
eukprot:364341-Chlamydomonas_euryale.AAC.11